MTVKYAFDFVSIPATRSTGKPRTSGLTSIIDYGIPLANTTSLLDTTAHLIDIAKIATATSRVYDEAVLIQKLEAYASYDVFTQMGGQFAEYVFATAGVDGVKRLFVEAHRLGFDIVEISDCCRPLDHEQRRSLVEVATDVGLRVVCEVGGYEGTSDPNKIIEDIQFTLQLGVERVIIEGAELVDRNGFKKDVVDLIRQSTDIDRLIFEMPGPGISAATPDKLEALKRGLILEFGPDVSIGNLHPDEVIETEVVRIGIEDSSAWPS